MPGQLMSTPPAEDRDDARRRVLAAAYEAAQGRPNRAVAPSALARVSGLPQAQTDEALEWLVDKRLAEWLVLGEWVALTRSGADRVEEDGRHVDPRSGTTAPGGSLHISAGRDVTVAGRDVTTGERRPIRLDGLSLGRRVAGLVVAFLVSVAAGFAVWFWTRDDESARELSVDLPRVSAELDESGHRPGTVHGCNTYGENCEGNPIYEEVPPTSGYDWSTWPKVATVPNGTELVARCWALGAVTTNYASRADPPDHGPDPYASDTYYNVQAPNGRWGWIPDTYFVRDQNDRLGLPRCPSTG
jgi:hypothetical protein